eukprot:CAMPEP_0114693518 /NCGR_PEP_ID=MMETSP0191-20121206/69154_1 /TAXON_ID=126664 /ORGANISM="Sorites sp." /LENGTH=189 /DNA_ID=CAMNT_0001987273 /DNA_START=9 /DNA_END=575 /DNA_ORIENTATION=+
MAWIAAAAAFVLELLVGLLLMYLSRCQRNTGLAPKSSCKVLMGRGIGTFCVMLAAMVLARSLPALAGIVANLPLVSGMVISFLWLGYGEDVVVRALGPMTIGMLSAAAYAMFASELMLLWHPAVGCVVSWLVSIAVITKPTLMILQAVVTKPTLMILQRIDDNSKEKEPQEVAYDPAKARSEPSSEESS